MQNNDRYDVPDRLIHFFVLSIWNRQAHLTGPEDTGYASVSEEPLLRDLHSRGTWQASFAEMRSESRPPRRVLFSAALSRMFGGWDRTVGGARTQHIFLPMKRYITIGAMLAAAAGWASGNTVLGIFIGALIGASLGAAFWALSNRDGRKRK